MEEQISTSNIALHTIKLELHLLQVNIMKYAHPAYYFTIQRDTKTTNTRQRVRGPNISTEKRKKKKKGMIIQETA